VGEGAGTLRVVLIGPESTGKTRLAEALAARYGVPWSPEFAREYAEGRTTPLTIADVDAIGRGQKEGEDATLALAGRLGVPLAILDTDLVSTAIYSRHYYGDCPAWIEDEARARRGDLYLLHHVDVPWVAEDLQREQPERREELLERFRRTLAQIDAAVIDVFGSWAERRRLAIEAVDRLLETGSPQRLPSV
jgi:NadR type nicotinamide-nucleotide adenylyltransferase